MLTYYNPPNASRIAGMGALLRSLRGHIKRARRFGEHRASTPGEAMWAARLFDALNAAFIEATADPAALASLHARDRRARRSAKIRRQPDQDALGLEHLR